MSRLPCSRILPLCAALTALAALPGAAQKPQRYLLRHEYAAGDVHTMDSGTLANMKIEVEAAGRESRTINTHASSRTMYREEVLKADALGPIAVRQKYSLAENRQIDPNGEEKKTRSPLTGRTAVVQRGAGGQIDVSCPGPKLPPDRIQLLKKALIPDENDLLPNEPVALGEEWTIGASGALGIRSVFSRVDRLKVKCRLAELVSLQGQRCAKVVITLNVVGQIRSVPTPVELDGTGSLYYSLGLRRVLALDILASIDTELQQQRQGETVTARCHGQFQAREVYQWQKVAGKPVAASAAQKVSKG